jgi:hypothetical protein
MSDEFANPLILAIAVLAFGSVSWLALLRPEKLYGPYREAQGRSPLLGRLDPSFRYRWLAPIAMLSMRVTGIIAGIGAIVLLYFLILSVREAM